MARWGYGVRDVRKHPSLTLSSIIHFCKSRAGNTYTHAHTTFVVGNSCFQHIYSYKMIHNAVIIIVLSSSFVSPPVSWFPYIFHHIYAIHVNYSLFFSPQLVYKIMSVSSLRENKVDLRRRLLVVLMSFCVHLWPAYIFVIRQAGY